MPFYLQAFSTRPRPQIYTSLCTTHTPFSTTSGQSLCRPCHYSVAQLTPARPVERPFWEESKPASQDNNLNSRRSHHRGPLGRTDVTPFFLLLHHLQAKSGAGPIPIRASPGSPLPDTWWGLHPMSRGYPCPDTQQQSDYSHGVGPPGNIYPYIPWGVYLHFPKAHSQSAPSIGPKQTKSGRHAKAVPPVPDPSPCSPCARNPRDPRNRTGSPQSYPSPSSRFLPCNNPLSKKLSGAVFNHGYDGITPEGKVRKVKEEETRSNYSRDVRIQEVQVKLRVLRPISQSSV
jgi:hypothetical protein